MDHPSSDLKPVRPHANPFPPESHRKSLSPGQLTAINLVLAGHTVASIARQMAVSKRTLFRWKLDPRFESEIRRRTDSFGSRPSPTNPPPRVERRPSWARGLSAEEEAEIRAEAAALRAISDALLKQKMPQSSQGADGVKSVTEWHGLARNVTVRAHANMQNEPK